VTALERLHRRSTIDPDGCWIWNGCVNNRGYGCIANGAGKTVLVHRFAHELLVGPLTPGLQVDHICHNSADCPGGNGCAHRRCWRPDHLEQVTGRENCRRRPAPRDVCHRLGRHGVLGVPHTDSTGIPKRCCYRCGMWVPVPAAAA
jgi:hypothetical protein